MNAIQSKMKLCVLASAMLGGMSVAGAASAFEMPFFGNNGGYGNNSGYGTGQGQGLSLIHI